MCDMIRQYGQEIIPFNFGAKSSDPRYKDEGTRAWYELSYLIKLGKIVAPPAHQVDSKRLFAQLGQRRQSWHVAGGKLWMETKEEMRSRGLRSPDLADAMAMAFSIQTVAATSYMPYDDSRRQEIAKEHGWDYTPDQDPGSPYRDDDGTTGVGFGGVHSIW
jgi:hypothetical protein